MGVPVLVLRDKTERPEGIEANTMKLAGTREENIYRLTKRLLDDRAEYEKMSQSSNPYGDGTASRQIVNHIIQYFNGQNRAFFSRPR
jgi:UDP-N-acetylglucosamine 2-epimerase (non-hydrolysing)